MQEEIDEFWEKLSRHRKEVQCGWLKDRYGISWQIVPTVLGDLLSGPDLERSERVMKAMFQVVKVDVGKLQKA